jgi:aryl-alcohol dehydrogenase-like predicted oxidoreductase
MGMSEFRGPIDDRESTRTIREALHLGVALLDTADIYGCGHNEILVGKAICHWPRDHIILSTKVGIIRTGNPQERLVCGKRDYIRRSCEESLRRLGIDHIDLYYVHRLDPATPVEETMLAMAELVAAGKVRHVGLSEAGAADIRRAHAVHPLTAVQSEWSLFTRHLEADVVGTCRELGIGLVAFSPLARGMLTDHIRELDQLAGSDDRRSNPRFAAGNFEQNLRLVTGLREFAAQRRVSVCQLALAWVQHRGGDVVPIPGAETRTHVAENVRAVGIELSTAELTEIERLCPADAVAGHRIDARGHCCSAPRHDRTAARLSECRVPQRDKNPMSARKARR